MKRHVKLLQCQDAVLARSYNFAAGLSIPRPLPYLTLPERPLTNIPVENLRAGSAARRESQKLTPTTAAYSRLPVQPR